MTHVVRDCKRLLSDLALVLARVGRSNLDGGHFYFSLTNVTASIVPAPALVASAPSRLHCRVKTLELDAGVGGGEAPIDGGMAGIAASLPAGYLAGQMRAAVYVLAQVLAR